jgi:Holliday junction resolvase RusA-like endonuclease
MDVVLEMDKLFVSDVDNHQKLLQDAVCEAMDLDDRRIVSLRLDKMKASGKPQTTVRVWRLYE